MKSNYGLLVINTISNFFIIAGVGIFVFAYGPILYSEITYRLVSHSETAVVVMQDNNEGSVPAEPKTEDSLGIDTIKAVNDKFAVIIPKIDVNAPVVENVSMVDEGEYMGALEKGVAHAQGTSLPGQAGNMFFFAHSSLNFWKLGPYATVFNLLNKLEKDDLVLVVKDSKTYIYKVKKAEIVSGWNTEPFDVEYEEPMLTLVTCYPPGTTINRYVVTAVYVGVQE